MPVITGEHTDEELLKKIGRRLRSYRLQQNLTAAIVANRAGLNPNTVVNAEAGKNPRLLTILRLLRVYGRTEATDAFLPEPRISPLEVVQRKGRVRQRARSSKDG